MDGKNKTGGDAGRSMHFFHLQLARQRAAFICFFGFFTRMSLQESQHCLHFWRHHFAATKKGCNNNTTCLPPPLWHRRH